PGRSSFCADAWLASSCCWLCLMPSLPPATRWRNTCTAITATTTQCVLTMQFDDQFDFDCAAATLLRMFSDPGYYRAKYERLGGPQPEFVAHKLENDVFTITVRHVLTVADLQLRSFGRKRVGDHRVLREIETWQRECGRGEIDVEIESKPITTRSDLALGEQGHGTLLLMSLTIAAD